MPADHLIDVDRRMVYSRAWGRVTGDDLLTAQAALGTDPAFDPGFDQLYDFTQATEIAVTRDVFVTLRARRVFGPHARHAIVVGTQTAFGLARMYELTNDLTARGYAVFRDLGEARAWLGLDRD